MVISICKRQNKRNRRTLSRYYSIPEKVVLDDCVFVCVCVCVCKKHLIPACVVSVGMEA